jgi:hypothetical protein
MRVQVILGLHTHARAPALRRTIAAALAAAATLAAPCLARAATTVGSPLTVAPSGGTCGGSTYTNIPRGRGGFRVPFAGILVRWRLDLPAPGEAFTYRLRVLRPAGGSEYTGVGTGPPQAAPLSGVNVIPLPTPLPVQPGDLIGVDCPLGAPTPYTVSGLAGSAYAFFSGGLADGSTASPNNEIEAEEELVNADVVAAPGVTSVSPSSGPAAGGTSVTISGTHLADVTSVSFGGVPATAVKPASESTVTATAPAHAGGTVDVRVTNAAGTSPAGPVDSFTYQASPLIRPLAPIITSVAQSNAVWREGNKLPQISRRSKRPVGTTISFVLNEPASVTFSFLRRVSGRRVRSKCVAKTRKNAKRNVCERLVAQGSLSFTGHAGTNSVQFAGRTSAVTKLRPGRYTLAITTANSAGASAPASLSFTIVK